MVSRSPRTPGPEPMPKWKSRSRSAIQPPTRSSQLSLCWNSGRDVISSACCLMTGAGGWLA